MPSLSVHRRSVLRALRWGLLILALGRVAPLGALPHTAVKLLEGRVQLLPASGGGAKSVVRLKVRNLSDAPIEALRLRLVFPASSDAELAQGHSRERLAYFPRPLPPESEGEAVLEERGEIPFPRVEVLAVVPVLRVRLNDAAPELDSAPFVWRGVIQGPLAQIARRLGMSVSWDQGFQIATVHSRDHVLVLQLRTDRAVVDGRLVKLPGVVRDARGVLIAPLADALRHLGATVSHDAETNVLAVEYR